MRSVGRRLQRPPRWRKVQGVFGIQRYVQAHKQLWILKFLVACLSVAVSRLGG